GFGVWSLAFGQMSGQITASIAYWRVTRNQLSLAFDRKIAYRLLSFGTKLSVITFVGILSQTVDQVVIARYLDASQLGYFVLGSMLPELAVMGVCVSASQVFFPTFSRVQAKPRLLRASYLLSLKYVVMITFPVAIGVAIVAEDFVTIAYSELWAASVPII
ncbi:oligosaccharide flippase family protein, partial [Falsihalocynthiibacter sp. CO-5D18]